MGSPPARLQVSAVLPAYEEAEALDWVVERALQALARQCESAEVILVVHAASRDGTLERAEAWARREPRVRLVVQPAEEGGYGRALALGVRAARLPWVFLCDADGQLDPLDFPALAAAANDVDLVAGVRSPRVDPWPRRLTARAYNLLLAVLLGVRLRDADCAFKLFRREALGGAGLTFLHLADGELAARLVRKGARWREVELRHYSRRGGRSRAEVAGHLPRPRLVAAVLREIFALRRELREGAGARRARD
jgi:glycosyltransferase involved in cell wall biosynthesis